MIEEIIYITVNFLATPYCVQICFSCYLSMYSLYKTIGSKCVNREIAIWKVHHMCLENWWFLIHPVIIAICHHGCFTLTNQAVFDNISLVKTETSCMLALFLHHYCLPPSPRFYSRKQSVTTLFFTLSIWDLAYENQVYIEQILRLRRHWHCK